MRFCLKFLNKVLGTQLSGNALSTHMCKARVFNPQYGEGGKTSLDEEVTLK